jgi:hypothetical protein
MTSWFPTFSAVIGLLAGGGITYMTSRAQIRIQAERDYDVALRDLRLPHYQVLFHLTGAIPREWWPSSALTRRDVLELRERFHDWYFGEGAGGLFLSQDARTAYSALQVELQEAARNLASDEDLMSYDVIGWVKRLWGGALCFVRSGGSRGGRCGPVRVRRGSGDGAWLGCAVDHRLEGIGLGGDLPGP